MVAMRRFLRPLLAGWLGLAILSSTLFAGGPENLLLVVNADSPSSLLLANHYIDLRQIPERNVVYLSEIPDLEKISLSVFQSKILAPVLSEIQDRKLSGNIDYIVYSADFPAAVKIQAHQTRLFELAEEKGKPIAKGSRRIFRAEASISSLTYYADSIIQNDPTYMLLNSNYYYRGSPLTLLDLPFFGEIQEDFRAALERSKTDVKEGIRMLEKLRRIHPDQLAVLYLLAKFYAQTEDYETAAQLLGEAVQQGWSFRRMTERDPEFSKAMRNSDLVREQVEKIPDESFECMPTIGFKRSRYWSPNGGVNGLREQGRSFYLSSVLAVTRNQGCTENEALESLKRNAVVDGSKPEGTFYFADTSDVRNTTRKPNYRIAIDALRRMGFQTQIVKDKVPIKRDDVLGLTNGTAKFTWKSSGSTMMPGAIGDNLTSYGGDMSRAAQTKCTEFIIGGAAGASGTVVEPYALQAKFPHPMIHAHYARGATLGEAFYQSVHGPFQLLIVGDALCKPFATIPSFQCSGVEGETVISGAVEMDLDFSGSPVECREMELYIDGQLITKKPVAKKFRFDSKVIPDGYHEIRVVAIADNLLATTGRVVLPVFVDNHGYKVELSTDRKAFEDSDDVTFKIRSNYGERIVLKQNFRKLAESKGKEVEFTVPASQLGRGPIRLTAVAYDDKGIPVTSVPLELEIRGEISNTRRKTE